MDCLELSVDGDNEKQTEFKFVLLLLNNVSDRECALYRLRPGWKDLSERAVWDFRKVCLYALTQLGEILLLALCLSSSLPGAGGT